MDRCEFCLKNETEDGYLVSETEYVPACAKCQREIPESHQAQIVTAIMGTPREERSFGHLRLTAMFQTGQAPRIETEDTFFKGWQGAGGKQFASGHPGVMATYMEEAKRAGISTQGKVYMHGLATYPGDPTAWVGTKAEAKKIVQERGWGSDDLKVKARNDLPPAKDPAIADDIVAEYVDKELSGIPEADRSAKLVNDTAEKVVRKHSKVKV